MSTIDEILATGRYTDRRGRVWKIVRSPLIGTWWGTPRTDDVKLVLHENKMRLLIERDQHRDVCEGLDSCITHPVPHVIAGRAHAGQFAVYGRGPARIRPTLPEAMDAARALAVSE